VKLAAARVFFVWILAAAPAARGASVHRLNRAEYNNTIRDLTGVDFKLRNELPPDDSGYGFDNIADVLSLSPALMERYFAIASRVVQDPDVQKRLLVCHEQTDQCARRVVSSFARRAYRRPVTAGEIDRLLRFLDQARAEGDSFEHGLLLALRAVLVSPNFLFRIEQDPASDLALASRLSYFLWSSTPDEELLGLAEQGRLRGPGTLDAQVRRMLADPKSEALVENFGGQWLEFRNLDDFRPYYSVFPTFNGRLRNDMRRETTYLFDDIIYEDRSIFDFIDPGVAYLNQRLAEHYGIPNVMGLEFRRVPLGLGSQRGGILTQGSILAVTSYPSRTSPVLRGKFLLSQILNSPPPPPPANVPALPETEAGKHATARELMEAHRANPACAACHTRMDPLGFALENYDAIGRWRDTENGSPIDSRGVLPGGRTFRKALASKLLTYALGRGLADADQPAIEEIRRQLAANGDRFSVLVSAVVHSAPFQNASAPPQTASENQPKQTGDRP
jgi:hypothetical protein